MLSEAVGSSKVNVLLRVWAPVTALSTYLLVRRKNYFLTFNEEDDGEIDIVGRFSI